jgi:hypothetical protein
LYIRRRRSFYTYVLKLTYVAILSYGILLYGILLYTQEEEGGGSGGVLLAASAGSAPGFSREEDARYCKMP